MLSTLGQEIHDAIYIYIHIETAIVVHIVTSIDDDHARTG